MSNVIAKLNSTKDIVIELLTKYEHYRNNDEKLVAHVWNREMKEKGVNPVKISAYDFLVRYGNGNLTAADILTRARRKIQEQHPELRGSKWKERHEEEKEVRQNINK